MMIAERAHLLDCKEDPYEASITLLDFLRNVEGLYSLT